MILNPKQYTQIMEVKSMIVTKKYIRELREKSFVKISKEAKEILLEQLGHEPELDEEGYQYIYTEQDLWEQARKIIREHPVKVALP